MTDVILGYIATLCANIKLSAVKSMQFHCLKCFQTLHDVKNILIIMDIGSQLASYVIFIVMCPEDD